MANLLAKTARLCVACYEAYQEEFPTSWGDLSDAEIADWMRRYGDEIETGHDCADTQCACACNPTAPVK